MIDDQFEFARLHNRKVGWLGALENMPGMDTGEAPGVYDAGAVAHQSADFGIFTVWKCCRDSVAHRQVDQLNTTAAKKRITGDEKCVGPLTHERREDRIDVLRGLDVVK